MQSDNSLAAVAAGGSLADLEAAWLEALAQPYPASRFLDALAAVPDGLRGATAVSLLLLLLEAAGKQGRHADVVEVIRALHPYRQQKVDLKVPLLAALEGQYGKEPWHALFLDLSGLNKDQGDMLDALDRHVRLTRLVPGSVVYHRSGWGEGLITGHDLASKSFQVTFREDHATRTMPFSTGLDVLQPLDPADLRARLLTDVPGLQREAEEAPERLLQSVARLHKGRATVKEIKQWLSGTVIEEKSWNNWWKKAKVAASRDPYLAVENPARPVFVLRQRALTPLDEMRAAMQRATRLPDLLAVVRGPLSLDPSPDVQALMLEELGRRTGRRTEGAPEGAARVEAGLLLVRHGARPPEFAAAFVDAAVARGPGLASLMDALPDATLRREAFDAFIAARPQLWSDAVLPELSALSPQLLDTVADRLLAAGRGDALANRFHVFLLSPSRHAQAVMRLAKRYGTGMFEGVSGAPSLSEVFMGVLHLAETQAPKAERGDKPAKEIMRTLEELMLARKGGLIPPFAKAGTRGELAAAMGVLLRCRRMPDEIVSGLRRAVEARFPDLAPREEIPFWQTPGIFCTREGVRRRTEEYRILTQEKIPANSADIGRAASYGDLSENFEWTAAIEQQRQLTEKAVAMEAELRLAQPIEDQTLEPGVVSPGTRVTYVQDGVKSTIVILGPWDVGEGIVSYRAPLAAGMLGARSGETVGLDLPSGPATVTVESVEPALSRSGEG
jgi:transcription elongation GreA/GreB family factor